MQICLRLKRERESHMRQLSILYNKYMTVLDKLKNVDVSEEGHVINPAFNDGVKTDDLEAGIDEELDDDALKRETTLDFLQAEHASLSPWNNIGGSGRHTRATSKRSFIAKRHTSPTMRIVGLWYYLIM